MHACIVPLVLGAWLLLSPPYQQDRRDLYDAKADAAAAVEAARTKAAAENRRVLIVWGSDESEPCRAFDDVLDKNEDVREKLLYEYDLVRVDAGNLELARRLGAEFDKIPHLTVLDAKGAVLANHAAVALAPKPLLDFLTRHQAPYEKAEDVRARALKKAAAAGKKLLLTFGAPW